MKNLIGIICLFYLLTGGLSAQTGKMTTDPSEHKILVDYTKTLEQMILDGKYVWKHDSITEKNFPLLAKMIGQKVEVVIKPFFFGNDISGEEAIKYLSKDGYRPATLAELLAWGATNSETKIIFPTIALGFIWQDWEHHRYVPYIFTYEDKHTLRLGRVDKWSSLPDWCCLAVLKKN
jgi:hypothetical protein